MDPGRVGPAAAVEAGRRRRLEPPEDVEDLERDEPAAVGRVGRDARPAVGGRDRRGPLRPLLAQVLERDRRPRRREPVRDPLAQLAVVVGVEALVRERPQRAGEGPQRGPARPGAGPVRAAARRSGTRPSTARCRARRTSGRWRTASPSQAGKPASACSIAAARTASRDRRPHRPCASPHDRTAPGTVIAERAAERDPVEALRPRSASADAPDGARPEPLSADLLGRRLVPHQPERVAADPAAVGHDDGEDRVGRDGGVDRVPARRQDVEPGGRREVVRRDDRAAGAAGEPRRDHRRGPARVSHRPRSPPRDPRAGPVRCPPGARSAGAATAAAARSRAG